MFVRADFDIPLKPSPKQSPMSYLRFHKIGIAQLKKELVLSDLIANPSNDIEELYNQYHNTLSTLLDKHAPPITKSSNHPTPKWFNTDISKARSQKRQAERLWRKYKTTFTRSHFRKQINYCNSLISAAKRRIYTDTIKNVKNNPKIYGRN